MNHNIYIQLIIVACIIVLLFYFSSFSIERTGNLFLQKNSKILSSILTLQPTNILQCPLQGEKWIVVTTIFYPTTAIHKFLTLTTQWNLIVIADQKTPKDWLEHLTINSTRLVFVSFEEQKILTFRFFGIYHKDLMQEKILVTSLLSNVVHKIIFESDDDNLLETNDIYLLPKVVQPKHVPWIAFHRQRSPFINIYGSFGHPQIWPRGFPLMK